MQPDKWELKKYERSSQGNYPIGDYIKYFAKFLN